MRFIKIIFPFVVFVLVLLNSPQRAVAATEVITVSFSKTLTPSAISGAINPELSNRLINVNTTPGSSSISDMVGATSSSAVNWNARGINNTILPASSNLLEGYLTTSGTFVNGGNNVWFTGLAKNSKYTIYVYSQSSIKGAKTEINYTAPKHGDPSLNAGTLTTNISRTTYVNKENYLVITTNADEYGYLSVNYSALTGSSDAVVNAVQIKAGDPATAHAPEPSSVVLMGIGGIFAGILWRKKQQSVNLVTNHE